MRKSSDLMAIIQDCEWQCPSDAVFVKYAEFYNEKGNLVARFQGSGWIRVEESQKVEDPQVHECLAGCELWKALTNAAMEKMNLLLPVSNRHRLSGYQVYEEEPYVIEQEMLEQELIKEDGFDRKA